MILELLLNGIEILLTVCFHSLIFYLMIYGFCLLNIWDSGISIATLMGTQSNGKNVHTFF